MKSLRWIPSALASLALACSEADWGFDSDNVLASDNFKLERVYAGCPPLTVSVSDNNVTVTWGVPSTGSAKLQSASSINGSRTDMTPAPTSPYTVPVTGTPKFFRTVWVPPAL